MMVLKIFFNNFKRSKLCIIGNNSTTFLQTLTLDIPTILFWDENIIKIRNNSIKYFEFLKEVGIFSKNSDLAANFCNNTLDVYKWWHNKKGKI